MPRLPSLQLLRFFAALSVVLFHVGSGLAQEYPNLSNPFSLGLFGVDVFFVLSGFIMAYATDPARGSLHFALRRVARIVPLYWFLTLALVGIALVLPQLLNSTKVSAEALGKSLLFIPYEKPNGAVQPILFLGWTLCYEMFFYAIYCIALNAGRMTIPVAALGLMAFVAFGWVWPPETALGKFYTAPILIEFILGMGLFVLFSKLKPKPSVLAAVGCILVSVTLFYTLQGQSRFLAIGLPSAAIVAAFLCLPYRDGRAMTFLVLLGDASYSLYLSHPYVIQLPIKVLGDRFGLPVTAIAAVFAVAIAILLSILLYFWIEKPAQRAILKRFSRTMPSAVSPARSGQGAEHVP